MGIGITRPPRLSPGDPIRLVAGSGPVDIQRFHSGVEILARRYELIYDEDEIFAREGYLAGSDEHRLESLNMALADPECRAIVMARGGYGLTRILSGLDREALRRYPKVIVGYSDITALLAWAMAAGCASIYGPMISDLDSLAVEDRLALVDLLENPSPAEICTDLEPLVGGLVEGPLIGGNLVVLTRLLGTPWQPDLQGAILFLEEVGEQPYRIDRMLTHLQSAGVFDVINGLVLGDFVGCEEAGDGKYPDVSLKDVLFDKLGGLRVPVVMNGGFGHGKRKRSIPYGVRARLEAGDGRLSVQEGVVS